MGVGQRNIYPGHLRYNKLTFIFITPFTISNANYFRIIITTVIKGLIYNVNKLVSEMDLMETWSDLNYIIPIIKRVSDKKKRRYSLKLSVTLRKSIEKGGHLFINHGKCVIMKRKPKKGRVLCVWDRPEGKGSSLACFLFDTPLFFLF